MTITAKDFFDFATVLADKNTPSEIDLRTAGSRAYYGAFHSTVSIVELCEDVDIKAGMHKISTARLKKGNLIEFGAENNKVKSIGVMLDQIRDIRAGADYRLKEDFSKHDTDLCLLQAKRIMQRTEEVLETIANSKQGSGT